MPSDRALVVDDDAGIVRIVRRALEQDGYQVHSADSGVEAMSLTAKHTFEVVVLDVNIPPPDGLALCRLLRARGDDSPVLLLTERGAVDDRVAGLDAGADDYLPKPFDLRELQARIRAIRRRAEDEQRAQRRLQVGDLVVDRELRRVHRGDTEIDLSAREYALLIALMQRAGRLCTRERLLDLVWAADEQRTPKVVDVYVGYLRRKIDEPFGTDTIETIRGAGYRLRPTA